MQNNNVGIIQVMILSGYLTITFLYVYSLLKKHFDELNSLVISKLNTEFYAVFCK